MPRDERADVAGLFLLPLECDGVCDLRRCPLLLRPVGVSDLLLVDCCPAFEAGGGAFLAGGDESRLFAEDERWSSPLRTNDAFLLTGEEFAPLPVALPPLQIQECKESMRFLNI